VGRGVRLDAGLLAEGLPTRSADMDSIFFSLGAGLVTIINGAFSAVDLVLSPIPLALAVCAGGMWWLAGIEVEELTRQGTKPEIQLH
jgi:hypothetical protein